MRAPFTQHSRKRTLVSSGREVGGDRGGSGRESSGRECDCMPGPNCGAGGPEATGQTITFYTVWTWASRLASKPRQTVQERGTAIWERS